MWRYIALHGKYKLCTSIIKVAMEYELELWEEAELELYFRIITIVFLVLNGAVLL